MGCQPKDHRETPGTTHPLLHSKKAHNGGTFSRAKKSPHWVAGITENK
uniref:Uncharacterized protein n=1 Tax=Siphoviridae sp. ctsYA13 TaxID=2825695 RepID=A0A8S5VBZ7_9CAUD|nr:MAG TPA: hypothetical protein [Siphoviridae sp. ctsYA13]DAI88567.1 MAG TPA: hypothetical protein [Caudoviricetes sp.]DAN86297.1 MAG TPA: hypothetical protein [Caudoviricetes sp.]